jgi:hypothetical protein
MCVGWRAENDRGVNGIPIEWCYGWEDTRQVPSLAYWLRWCPMNVCQVEGGKWRVFMVSLSNGAMDERIRGKSRVKHTGWGGVLWMCVRWRAENDRGVNGIPIEWCYGWEDTRQVPGQAYWLRWCPINVCRVEGGKWQGCEWYPYRMVLWMSGYEASPGSSILVEVVPYKCVSGGGRKITGVWMVTLSNGAMDERIWGFILCLHYALSNWQPIKKCLFLPGYVPIAIANWSIIVQCHLLVKHAF